MRPPIQRGVAPPPAPFFTKAVRSRTITSSSKPPGEPEFVAGLHARDETFFHGSELLPARRRAILHQHARIRDDGADVQPMSQRQPLVA